MFWLVDASVKLHHMLIVPFLPSAIPNKLPSVLGVRDMPADIAFIMYVAGAAYEYIRMVPVELGTLSPSMVPSADIIVLFA